jgi:hypothetical protein
MSDVLSQAEIDALLSGGDAGDECDEQGAGPLDFARVVYEGEFMYIPDFDGNVYRTKQLERISLKACPSQVIKKFIKWR